jgi:hypothetical protein
MGFVASHKILLNLSYLADWSQQVQIIHKADNYLED